MKRLMMIAATIIAATLSALLAASCGGGDEEGSLGDAPTGPKRSGTSGGSGAPQAPPQKPTRDTITVEAWFASDTGLFVTRRSLEATPRIGEAALTALLDGPSQAERQAGVSSAIPEASELRGLTIEDGLATVDLSAHFEGPGGSAGEFIRLAQLVFTLTQFETVDAVALEIDGDPVEAFGGHGIVFDGPLTRKDFRDQLPPILVESPGVGETVSSPVTLSGTANVFEATVSISILDASGNEIVRTFTTATCGTGCRGSYAKTVPFEVDETQPGVISVYESSAEDGSELHTVEIPVTLEASTRGQT